MAFKVNLKRINKNWIVLGVAIVVGGIAAFTAQSYLSDKIRQIEEREKSRSQITVVVPKTNLEKGTELSPENVATRAIPKEWAPSTAITPDQFSRAQGSALAASVVGGEPLMWAHLEPKRAPNFSASLQPGRRAVTLPVDEISSISGMLQPGDIIDIIVSVTLDGKPIPTTFTLLQSATVLATGTYNVPGVEDTPDGRKSARSYSTVTLDASPEDSKRIIAARNIGRITALLRAPGDLAPVATVKRDAYAILGLNSNVKVSRPREIEIIYGGSQLKQPRSLNPPVVRRAVGDQTDRVQGENVVVRTRSINPAPAATPVAAPAAAAQTQQATATQTQQAIQQAVQAIQAPTTNNNNERRAASSVD